MATGEVNFDGNPTTNRPGNSWGYYLWNLGDGNDTIEDSAGTNVLKLGEGVEVATWSEAATTC